MSVITPGYPGQGDTTPVLTTGTSEYLKLVGGMEALALEPTTGQRSYGYLVNDSGSWVSPDFRKYGCNVPGFPTEAGNVQVYELIKQGTLEQIYGSMGRTLDEMCLSQEQIFQYNQTYRNLHAPQTYSRFLFKVGNEFFIAQTMPMFEAGFNIYLEIQADHYTWQKRVLCADKLPPRFVFPQFAA